MAQTRKSLALYGQQTQKTKYMHDITIDIKITAANDKQWLEISNMLKTILAVAEMAIEDKHPGNDAVVVFNGAHPDSVTNMPSKAAIDHAMSIGQVKPK